MLFEDDNAADDTNTTDDALVAGPAPSSALVVAPQAPPAGACLSHILLPPNSRACFSLANEPSPAVLLLHQTDRAWISDLLTTDFFRTVAVKNGNNRMQCTGKCGPGFGDAKVGRQGDWPVKRQLAHILAYAGHHVAACTSLPKTTIDGRALSKDELRQWARTQWEKGNRDTAKKANARTAIEAALEPARIQKSFAKSSAAAAATASNPFQMTLASSPTGMLAASAVYTVDESREAWTKAFVMHGLPYSLFDSPIFRHALKTTANCKEPAKIPCKGRKLCDTYGEQLNVATHDDVNAILKFELPRYGGCILSDGAKGSAQTPFMNFLVGIPGAVVFLEAQDTSKWVGNKKTNLQLTKESIKLVDKISSQIGLPPTATIGDLYIADGACRSMANDMAGLIPNTTFSICFPHSVDRIFNDLFKLEWALPLKAHTHTVLDYVMNHGQPLSMFKEASAEHMPTLHTRHLQPDQRKPSMPARAAETRMASEFYSMESMCKLRHVFVQMVTAEKYGWAAWVGIQDANGKAKANVVRAAILDDDVDAECKAFCLKVNFI